MLVRNPTQTSNYKYKYSCTDTFTPPTATC